MRSPFLGVPQSEWIANSELAFAIWDLYPVSQGHALVIPKREVATWWDTTEAEKKAVWDLVDRVKVIIDGKHAPQGYNVGFNAGKAAGQTVFHLHMHVIPRYDGDVPFPRGGIRWIFPGKADYLQAASPPEIAPLPPLHLLPGGDDQMLKGLRDRLRDPLYDRIDLVVSFVMKSGIDDVLEDFEGALRRQAHIRILTTDYLNITDSRALLTLNDLAKNLTDEQGLLDVRVFHTRDLSFHPKGYIFWSSSNLRAEAFVGSSNLSRSALSGGIEWNILTERPTEMRAAFEDLWRDPRVRPLSEEWLRDYRTRRPKVEEITQFQQARELPEAVEPHPVQVEALTALAETRRLGFGAGLVVMATGLGKTFLAAFDSNTPDFRRALFIAHREEILRQSGASFRRVRPNAMLGFYYGKEKEPTAEVVFASIQTLAGHLDAFPPDAFDYIVVDEFHHASASSYRMVLDHFTPKFLLGLTATPERMDGADLLSLCGDNLVFDCHLVEGIRRKLLCPFEYFGIKDVVDFAPIPWRNGRFDPAALTRAVETRERADQALAEWRKHGEGRTLAFCCSTTHADFMAAHFTAAGVASVAVHSGPTSAPRSDSVEALKAGRIQVLFSVDVFNEGLDVPEIDTVLMLRPTESPVIFLQQLGRGLRVGREGKVLTVVDFIGNHRSFLIKPRTLLSLGSRTAPGPRKVLDAMLKGEFDLPEGCKVTYELEVIDMLRALVRVSPGEEIESWCREVVEETGLRPSAAQVYRAGYNPKSVRSAHGGWFEFARDAGLLVPAEARVLKSPGGPFLTALETEPITKSYKLVALRALLHEGALLTGLPLARLAEVSQALIRQDPRLARDAQGHDLPDPGKAPADAWLKYWRKWPVAAWLGELKGEPGAWFRLDGDRFVPRFQVPADSEDAFLAMAAELVEWRLAHYLAGAEPLPQGTIRCRVSHSGGAPIIRFPDAHRGSLPSGSAVEFVAEGETLLGDFVKVALNVARRPGQPGNALHALLKGWFGPGAGHPGTDHWVRFEQEAAGWVLRPDSKEAEGPGIVLPFYPDYKVACGAFGSPAPGDAAGLRRSLRPIVAEDLRTDRHFVCYARGDSMAGGPQPIRHGDPLLLAWVRHDGLSELEGQVVLVEKGAEKAAALKRLARRSGTFILTSDNPAETEIVAAKDCKVVARLVRRLDQREFNPLASRLHEQFQRKDIPSLFGETFNAGKWNSGHVSLDGQVVLFVTLDKEAMSAGSEYEDRLVAPNALQFTSQTSSSTGNKKGKELVECLDRGTEVHLFLRPNRGRRVFTYAGLVIPVTYSGDRPIHIRWRLLSSLTTSEWSSIPPA